MTQSNAITDLPVPSNHFANVNLARGSFDRILPLEHGLLVAGWMLSPEQEFDSIEVYLDGQPQGTAELIMREALGRWLWSIPHAKRSGFQAMLDRLVLENGGLHQINVLGCVADRPIAGMSTIFRADIDSAVVTPPPHLVERVVMSSDAHLFKINGFKCFGEFLGPIVRHSDFASLGPMLDWGCGCGRVSAHFLSLPNGPQVFGCDIDTEAVAWCRENLAGGTFDTVAPYPPTAYKDGTFDLVVSYSVFTHLTREAQDAWLAEIKRILAPGGLFAASVNGEFAASFAFPTDYATVLHAGIFDGKLDAQLDGIAPEGYYRSTYQTRAYTLREWSKQFEILEYVERGMNNIQDLVVMRRPTQVVAPARLWPFGRRGKSRDR